MTIYEILQRKSKLDAALDDFGKISKLNVTFYNNSNECMPFTVVKENDLYYIMDVLDRANFIDHGNADDLFKKLNFSVVNKLQYEITKLDNVDSHLRKVLVGFVI